MNFTFSDDQEMFRDSVRGLLERMCSPEAVRGLWQTESGRSVEMWNAVAELGLLGLMAPESAGGLGMDEVDLVLPLVETGRAAFPGPVVECAAVAVPMLRDLGDTGLVDRWLPAVANGSAILSVGHGANAFVADAHGADLLLLQHGDEIHAVPPAEANVTLQPTNDRGRQLFAVDWTPGAATRVCDGTPARALWSDAFDRGAFGCAAQLLGVAQQLVDVAVQYAGQREQFGKPIGSFQAIKHLLANVQVQIEFAKPLLYRAADSLGHASDTRSVDVSQAKATAGEAAVAAARTSLQVHGAIGYTWECDLQIWMKRAWSLDLAWGSAAWHRARIADAVIDGAAPARSFGFEPR